MDTVDNNKNDTETVLRSEKVFHYILKTASTTKQHWMTKTVNTIRAINLYVVKYQNPCNEVKVAIYCIPKWDKYEMSVQMLKDLFCLEKKTSA